jgi:uncharacterized membrane protein YdcZ (DUF606 family)
MRRALNIAAGAELVTLTLLLANLATVHLPAVSSVLGPVHGAAYLLVILLTHNDRDAGGSTKLLAWLPAVGGLLVIRRRARAGL